MAAARLGRVAFDDDRLRDKCDLTKPRFARRARGDAFRQESLMLDLIGGTLTTINGIDLKYRQRAARVAELTGWREPSAVSASL
jgi:hypothetical protein